MSASNGTYANGHAPSANGLPLQTWLVAANGLASIPSDAPREMSENEAAVLMNEASMRMDMTRRMLDPRRDVREAAGVPRNMPDALAFLRLYQDDAVAGAVVERYPDETYKVPGEVWDGDASPYGSGSVDEYEPGEDSDDDGETKSLSGAGGGGGSEAEGFASRGTTINVEGGGGNCGIGAGGFQPGNTCASGGMGGSVRPKSPMDLVKEKNAKAVKARADKKFKEKTLEDFDSDFTHWQLRNHAYRDEPSVKEQHAEYEAHRTALASAHPTFVRKHQHMSPAQIARLAHETGGGPVSNEDVWNAAPAADDTPFNTAWAELQAMIRTGGTKSYYKGEEYSPFWKLMRDWDVASRVGRYGVLFAGLDDGKRLSEPAAGLEEEGSVSDYFEYDYAVGNGVQEGDEEYDLPNRVRDGGWADLGGRRVVFNVKEGKKTTVTNAADRHGPWSLTWNAKSKAAKKVKESDKPLLYCRVFTEAHAVPVRWERNRNSPRYGQPTMWHIDFGDPLNTGAVTGPSDTAQVHWTRVRALKSDARFNSNVLAGVPACWPVYPELYNLQKYSAAAGEGYWTSGLPLRYMKTPAQIAGARTVVRRQTVRDETERMLSSVGDRFGIFENLEPGQLPSDITDPTPFEDAAYKKISVALNMPMRILIGDPQGALAGAEEDTGQWEDVVRGRQQKRAIPEQVVPVVDWFIMLGLLPEPKGGEFNCGWPAVDSLGDKERAEVMGLVVTAMGTFIEKGCDALMAPEDLYVEHMGYSPEEARSMLDRAAEAAEQRAQDEMDAQVEGQKRMVDEGLAPDPAMEHDAQALDLAAKVRPSAAPTDKVKPGKPFPPTKNEADDGDFWDFEADEPVYNKATGKTKLTGGQWVTLDNGVKVYLKSGKVVAGPRPVVEAMKDGPGKPKKDDAKDGPKKPEGGGGAAKEKDAAPAKRDPKADAAVDPRLPHTEAFKSWFGDSKVVGGDGKPLVVYHGTHADFDEFDASRARKTDVRGVFFGTNSNLAEAHGATRLVAAYVKIAKPAKFSDLERLGKSGVKTKDLHKKLQAEGFDGIFDRDKGLVVAFDGGQVKSASANSKGTFDPTKRSIYE